MKKTILIILIFFAGNVGAQTKMVEPNFTMNEVTLNSLNQTPNNTGNGFLAGDVFLGLGTIALATTSILITKPNTDPNLLTFLVIMGSINITAGVVLDYKNWHSINQKRYRKRYR